MYQIKITCRDRNANELVRKMKELIDDDVFTFQAITGIEVPYWPQMNDKKFKFHRIKEVPNSDTIIFRLEIMEPLLSEVAESFGCVSRLLLDKYSDAILKLCLEELET